MSGKTIFSQHHFMFPFRWDILPDGFGSEDIKENIPFDERTDLLNGIPDQFGNWKRWKYSLNSDNGQIDPALYNEFTYFHEFVSRALFDFDYPYKKNASIVKYYEYQIDKNLQNQYLIDYLEDGSLHNIELELDGISLHIFNTGVGVLSFNVSNIKPKQKGKETILKINEYGRRIYPQFLGENGIREVKGTFLPNAISLVANGQLIATDDFSWYELYNNKINVVEPYRLPGFITELFSDLFVFRISAPITGKKILITKVGDDRMFFQSWYGNNDIAQKVKDDFERSEKIEEDYLYCYIFGDKQSPSIANSPMKLKHLDDHTYKRWITYGTLFGLTRDSFVAISNDSATLKKYGAPDLRIHMQTMYYTLCVLCLAQRASVLKFTAEVANLADLAKLEEDQKFLTNIKDLYKNYIEFVNKLYFREITPQIQGIEMYNQFQKILNLKDEINDLDKELNELHNYVSLLQDSKRNEEAARLNRMAIFFLPFTVVFGILGANILGNDSFANEVYNPAMWLQLVGGLFFSGLISALIFLYYKLKNK